MSKMEKGRAPVELWGLAYGVGGMTGIPTNSSQGEADLSAALNYARWQYTKQNLAGDPWYYTLQELSEAASWYLDDRVYPRQFVGILHNIQGMNITPDAANQIDLIDDDQVNAWLHLSLCSTLTISCFVHRNSVVPTNGSDAVLPNKPLLRGNWYHLNPGQFDIVEFYAEPDYDSNVEIDPGRQAKRRKAFSRSHAGW
ncbi:hypothetical protein HOY82DRAFT_543927 [Tuber indicum]|nr:hypothetical protein HOY82DRAFT_543927 [Tuber indicum]